MQLRYAVAIVVTLGAAEAAQAQEPLAADTGWRVHLAYLPAGSGTWLASNERYRTADNGEPASYGQRYWSGFGKTTVHGCLWGEYPGQRPVFWHFFTAWDPERNALIVHQESGNGTIGLGSESIGTGIADQVFTRPGGGSSRSRHESRRLSADTMVTRSLDWVNDSWVPRREYTWVRQPVGTPAGC